MKEQIIDPELAEKEVHEWLDRKEVPESKRQKETLEPILLAVISGRLVFNEDGTILQKLKFPLKNDENEVTCEELTYKSSLNWKAVKPYMRGVKAEEVFDVLNAHICALTKKAMPIIEKLDLSDLSVSRSIAGFFLQ